MKKPSKFALRRAKSTLFGRLLCRLVGEERGAVMMEYVVIGVLVVAAAVAMVQLFGGGIRTQFKAMYEALLGKPGAAQGTLEEKRDTMEDDTGGAEGTGAGIAGTDVVE